MDLDENSFEWKEEYNIGVDIIDEAHRKLFRMVSRIIGIFSGSDFEKNKMTCIEAIKYLKNYAVKHFAEEEAFQLKIGDPGYKIHKQIHDNMRDVVIPALEKEVVAKGYSKKSLEHFVGVCAGWLSAHVLIEDRAIGGRVKSKWSRNADNGREATLNDIVRSYASDLFSLNADLFSKHYTGHKLDRLFCCNSAILNARGEMYSVTTAIEYPMLEVIARKFVAAEVFEMDAVMLSMLSELLNSFNTEVITALFNQPHTWNSVQTIPEKDFYAMYDERTYPDYSMLWRTYCGNMALAISKMTMGK